MIFEIIFVNNGMWRGMPDFPKRKSGFLRGELSSLRLRLIPRMHHRLEYTGSQNVSSTIADPVDSE
jgi:hypothetical protein